MLGPHRHEALAVVFQYPIRICIVDTVSRLGQPSGTMSSSRFGRGIPERQRRPLPLRRGAEDPRQSTAPWDGARPYRARGLGRPLLNHVFGLASDWSEHRLTGARWLVPRVRVGDSLTRDETDGILTPHTRFPLQLTIDSRSSADLPELLRFLAVLDRQSVT